MDGFEGVLTLQLLGVSGRTPSASASWRVSFRAGRARIRQGTVRVGSRGPPSTTASVVYSRFILAPYVEDNAGLSGSGHVRLGALVLRHRAEQLAAVGDELGAGREAGLVGRDEQHQPRELFRLGYARNRQAPY